MKTQFHAVFLMLFGLNLQVMAEETGQLTLTTDYMFRGISQTDSGPAVQGAISFSNEKGLFGGIAGSNVDFKGPPSTNPNVEIDVFAGASHKFGESLQGYAKLVHYSYPDAGRINTTEAQAGLGYRNIGLLIAYSDDWVGTGSAATYAEASIHFTLPEQVTITMHTGYSSFEDSVGIRDYLNYGIKANRSFLKVYDVEAAFYNTNMNQFGSSDDQRFVLKFIRKFSSNQVRQDVARNTGGN